jgi:hypothetical protein
MIKNHYTLGYETKTIEKSVEFEQIDVGKLFYLGGTGLLMKTEPSYNNKTNSVSFGDSAGRLLFVKPNAIVLPMNGHIEASNIE